MTTDRSIFMIDKFNLQSRVLEALNIAYSYGGIDGDHHKMWVIDRMVNALTGDEGYRDWVDKYRDGGEYEWDVGIAP